MNSTRLPPGSGYFPSTENASSTFPPKPPHCGYPDVVSTIPSAIAGPPTSIDPPRPFTPLTVVNSCAVLKSQMMHAVLRGIRAQVTVDRSREHDAADHREVLTAPDWCSGDRRSRAARRAMPGAVA